MQIKVIRAYTSEFPNPLKLKKGDIVIFDHSKDKHFGWKFCKTNNNEGWIPKSYLNINGKSAKLNRDYDATELSLKEGQVLEVFYEESGWFWCKTKDSKYGWYLKEATEAIGI